MRLTEERLSNHFAQLSRSIARSPVIAASIVLVLAAILGAVASPVLLLLLGVLVAGMLVLRVPALGALGLVVVSLVGPIGLPTGTEVELNLATMLVPAMLVLLVAIQIRHRDGIDLGSATLVPLYLLLLSLVVSMLVGNATWDDMVPRSGTFFVVQIAQILIFAFSAAAFWIGSIILKNHKWMQAITWTFIGLAGLLAVASTIPPVYALISPYVTVAITRAPLWVLVFAIAGGQALFNEELSRIQRGALVTLALVVLVNVFFLQRDAASNWVGVSVVMAAFVWLRWPRFRWVALFAVVLLVVSGLLVPTVWQFAGGDVEWRTSGASRLLLIERVLSDSLRNPLLGLGPAAYRAYGATRPLAYQQAFWVVPQINSHNNYVDLFSFAGLMGLAVFFWFVFEVGRLGLRMRRVYASGFESAFVNGMLAAGLGSLAIMMLADWILPFVYNIGFEGFQASVHIWLLLGGLLALETRHSEREKAQSR